MFTNLASTKAIYNENIFADCNMIYVALFILFIFIYYDLFPLSMRGTHVKSIIRHSPISPYTKHPRLDIRSCAIFTVYPKQAKTTQEPSKNTRDTLNNCASNKDRQTIAVITFIQSFLQASVYVNCKIQLQYLD